MPYEPIIPDGYHLGNSRDVSGASTGHLFEDGTNKLKGHAAWEWVDEPEYSYTASHRPQPARQLTPEEMELAFELAGIIVVGIIRAAAVTAPHLRRWWGGHAVPASRAAWRKIKSLGKKTSKESNSSSFFVEEAVFVASTTGLEISRPSEDIRMSSAEWELRFRSMLSAGFFAQEQMRILSIARVDERETILREPTASETMSPQQFIERVRLMLEANPTLLNEKTSAELMKTFDPNLKRL